MPRLPIAVCSPQKNSRWCGVAIEARSSRTCPGWKIAQSPAEKGSAVQECTAPTVSRPLEAGRSRANSSRIMRLPSSTPKRSMKSPLRPRHHTVRLVTSSSVLPDFCASTEPSGPSVHIEGDSPSISQKGFLATTWNWVMGM